MKKAYLILWIAALIYAITVFADSNENIRDESSTCCNLDGPGCVCFIDTGAWAPSGTWIQDVANLTLGTEESCENDGGKAYYQMRHGISDIDIAESISCLLDAWGDLYGREAWCSEAVSYWHHRTGIPYNGGYRNSTWNFDWQLINTTAVRSFYEAEELLPNGRGLWIDHTDPDYLDYTDFRPGENAPVPGSYVYIRQYIPTGPSSGTWLGCSHSLIIDSMFIYRNYFPHVEITNVKITFLEGNTGPSFHGYVNNTRQIDDIYQATPAGTSFVSYCEGDTVRKIVGFGIDLDSDGDPIYDSDRLKYLLSSYDPPVFDPQPEVADIEWDIHYADLIPQLVELAKTLGETGPSVGPSTDLIKMPALPNPRLPDGAGIEWAFPSTLDRYEPDGVYVDIDIMKDHPLPVKGIVLGWDTRFIPDGYSVIWASEGGRYKTVSVPSLAGTAPPDVPGTVPIPVIFEEQGASVRHVRLHFPYGTFNGDAVLKEIRFLFDWGPDTDAEYNPDVGACCLPDGSCTITTERMCETYGGTYHGDDTDCLGDADGDEIDDLCKGIDGKRGDCNGDGLINVLDVIATVNHILNIVPLSGNALLLADCNTDGLVNVLDALGIVNEILGISECGP